MIGKYPVPFALSGITLIMLSVGVMSSKLYAAESEAPAVLQFSTSYLEQHQHQPAVRLPVPAPVTAPPHKTTERRHTTAAPATRADRSQLVALRRDIEEKNRQITDKNDTISALEQQIATLKKSAVAKKPAELAPSEKKTLLDMAQSLGEVFSLHPAHNSLVEKLAQLKDQLKEAQLAETALRSQLKALNDGKDQVVSAHEAALQQQIEQHNKKIAELEETLAASRTDVQKTITERNETQAREQKLAEENAEVKLQIEKEQRQFAQEKKQLLAQIAHSREAEGQSESSHKQQVEQLAQLETSLSATREDLKKITAQRDDIQAREQTLAAAKAAEKQQFDKEKELFSQEKQQLLEQIARSREAESQSETSRKQQNEQQSLKFTQLEASLTATRDDLKKIAAERDDIQAREQKLAAEHAEVKQQLEQEKVLLAQQKKQLLEQIARGGQDKSQSENSKNQQIEQQSLKLAQLEASLTTTRDDLKKITAERDDIQAREQKLAADKSAEKQQFDKEKLLLAQQNKQLLEQIAQSRAAKGQSETSKQQQKKLAQQLSETQQLKEQLQKDNQQLKTELAGRPTAEQLAKSQLALKSLQAQIDVAQLTPPASETASLSDAAKALPVKNSDQESDKKILELQTQLDAAKAELAAAQKKQTEAVPAASQSSGFSGITPEQLKKKSDREGYAIGMSLGDEILQMQAENHNWGTTAEKSIVLAGIVDAFHGQAKLSTDVLRNLLTDVSKREEKASATSISPTDLDKATKQYLARFTKMKNTKKSPTGFWYNVDYIGDAAIAKDATLDVVVKESLTNGTVVTDMDTSGTILSQKVSDFPPVFREALKKLKNHGSITIVVPPELAYKDKGFPPKIPPNATIIYTLRIASATP